MSHRRVVLARTALTDLAKIGRWISEAGAPVTARRYVERIKSRLAGLADAGEAGRAFEIGTATVRVIGFERRVMIAYRGRQDPYHRHSRLLRRAGLVARSAGRRP